MSQVAHQARAYPGFCNMKRQGVFLLPPWLLPIVNWLLPIYSPGPGERRMMVKGLAQKPNTMLSDRACTQTTQSGDECTNHEATTTGRE